MSADLFATNAIINEARNEVASRSRIMEWLILETHQVCAVLCVMYQNVSMHMQLKQKRGPLSMTNKEQSKDIHHGHLHTYRVDLAKAPAGWIRWECTHISQMSVWTVQHASASIKCIGPTRMTETTVKC